MAMDTTGLYERLERQIHAHSLQGRGYVAGLAVKSAEVVGNEIRILGLASTPEMDRMEDVIVPEAYQRSLAAYLERNPIVLFQHDHDRPIGRTVSARITPEGLLVEDVIPTKGTRAQEEAAILIQQGILRSLSIGGIVRAAEWVQPDESSTREFRRITEVDLVEHSVVAVPANPGSLFTVLGKAHHATEPQISELIDQLERAVATR